MSEGGCSCAHRSIVLQTLSGGPGDPIWGRGRYPESALAVWGVLGSPKPPNAELRYTTRFRPVTIETLRDVCCTAHHHQAQYGAALAGWTLLVPRAAHPQEPRRITPGGGGPTVHSTCWLASNQPVRSTARATRQWRYVVVALYYGGGSGGGSCGHGTVALATEFSTPRYRVFRAHHDTVSLIAPRAITSIACSCLARSP